MDEQKLFEATLKTLEAFGPWIARCNSDVPSHQAVGAGSALRGDDARVHPYNTSHAVWSALSHGVDHVHAVRSLLRDARALHNYAPYTLLRAAIENAATAVWLLAPINRAERVERRLRLAVSDINGGEEVKELIGQPGPRSKTERMQQIRSLAAGMSGVNVDRAAAPIGYRKIVEAAGEQIELGADHTRLLWHMGSGIAHGDLWATVSAAQAVPLPGAPAGIAHMRVTASMNAVFLMVVAAHQLTEKGFTLYELRSRPI